MLHLLAQTSQPSTTVWTNLSAERLIGYIGAAVLVLGSLYAAAAKLTAYAIDFWFGTKKQIADRQAEFQADTQAKLKTLAQASHVSSTPVTPAIKDAVEAIANDQSTPSLIATSTDSPMGGAA